MSTEASRIERENTSLFYITQEHARLLEVKRMAREATRGEGKAARKAAFEKFDKRSKRKGSLPHLDPHSEDFILPVGTILPEGTTLQIPVRLPAQMLLPSEILWPGPVSAFSPYSTPGSKEPSASSSGSLRDSLQSFTGAMKRMFSPSRTSSPSKSKSHSRSRPGSHSHGSSTSASSRTRSTDHKYSSSSGGRPSHRRHQSVDARQSRPTYEKDRPQTATYHEQERSHRTSRSESRGRQLLYSPVQGKHRSGRFLDDESTLGPHKHLRGMEIPIWKGEVIDSYSKVFVARQNEKNEMAKKKAEQQRVAAENLLPKTPHPTRFTEHFDSLSGHIDSLPSPDELPAMGLQYPPGVDKNEYNNWFKSMKVVDLKTGKPMEPGRDAKAAKAATKPQTNRSRTSSRVGQEQAGKSVPAFQRAIPAAPSRATRPRQASQSAYPEKLNINKPLPGYPPVQEAYPGQAQASTKARNLGVFPHDLSEGTPRVHTYIHESDMGLSFRNVPPSPVVHKVNPYGF